MRGRLDIDLGAVAANWAALDRLSGPFAETAAVVKADAYGLGAAEVARALARAGARSFFVHSAEEGAALRSALGEGPEILLLSGLCEGDAPLVRGATLVPVLASPEQVRRFRADCPGAPAAVQVDTGINRLGIRPADLPGLLLDLLGLRLRLVMSHLACAEDPAHAMNALQLAAFQSVTLAFPGVRRSLAATAGLLLGPFFRFEMVRPGIGLYGGAPFADGAAAVRLALPVLQVRTILPGEAVGYGAAFTAQVPTRVATLGAGYADGIFRAAGPRLRLYAGDVPCPVLGRISMDLLTVDVSHLPEVPPELDLLSPAQGIDALAAAAGTIAHEVLATLGSRHARAYKGAVEGRTQGSA